MSPDLSHPMSSTVVPVFSRRVGSWQVSLGRQTYPQQELVRQYDREAGAWQGKIDRLGFEAAYGALFAKVLGQRRYTQKAATLRVLDAGIGTGAMSRAFCDTVTVPVRLTGVDISPAMLDQAQSRLTGRVEALYLNLADLCALPYPDETFDVVLAAHVLEHLPSPTLAIAELYRVLKPGGIVITCITRRSRMGAMIQLLWRTHQVERRQALDWLRSSGFELVRAVPLPRSSTPRRYSIGYVGRKPGG